MLLKFISVWVARRPPGYAFVEFADRRDAVDAIRGLDGEYKAFSKYKCQESLVLSGSLKSCVMTQIQMLHDDSSASTTSSSNQATLSS